MKQTPDMEKLDNILRSSQIVAGGFLGNDTRSVHEIIQADAATLDRLGRTLIQVAERMQEITDVAKSALGTSVPIGKSLRAYVDEAKGQIICPWPHPASFDKRLTSVVDLDLDEDIIWSDLHIHLISEHGFFEGYGSPMRIEPERLTNLIFKYNE